MCVPFSPHQTAMASNKKVAAPAVFALALLLVAYCAEAYMCTTQNRFFHGRCVNNLNCASSCVHGRLGTGGHCATRKRSAADPGVDIDWVWNRRICVCVFQCRWPSPPGGEEPPSGGEEPPAGGRQPPSLRHTQEIQPNF
ncbi:hypothetical protein SEVIR_5G448000v4 [Setaria viridis]|uniref:Knottin scorpion toxin-like domain-containing protein n=1 Tax=Setaria viridis TaxID=4556 RepID=A0A4U6UTZ6_SETVI|nr:major pollen allergen Art v 1-like [Setaria viridis]TKW18694.1 hypothetical protein SEVIR_5G448000v2 [Setaria viridis]